MSRVCCPAPEDCQIAYCAYEGSRTWFIDTEFTNKSKVKQI